MSTLCHPAFCGTTSLVNDPIRAFGTNGWLLLLLRLLVLVLPKLAWRQDLAPVSQSRAAYTCSPSTSSAHEPLTCTLCTPSWPPFNIAAPSLVPFFPLCTSCTNDICGKSGITIPPISSLAKCQSTRQPHTTPISRRHPTRVQTKPMSTYFLTYPHVMCLRTLTAI